MFATRLALVALQSLALGLIVLSIAKFAPRLHAAHLSSVPEDTTQLAHLGGEASLGRVSQFVAHLALGYTALVSRVSKVLAHITQRHLALVCRVTDPGALVTLGYSALRDRVPIVAALLTTRRLAILGRVSKPAASLALRGSAIHVNVALHVALAALHSRAVANAVTLLGTRKARENLLLYSLLGGRLRRNCMIEGRDSILGHARDLRRPLAEHDLVCRLDRGISALLEDGLLNGGVLHVRHIGVIGCFVSDLLWSMCHFMSRANVNFCEVDFSLSRIYVYIYSYG